MAYNSKFTGAQIDALLDASGAMQSSKEDVANKVTSINADADDAHYPSAKAVKDKLDDISGKTEKYILEEMYKRIPVKTTLKAGAVITSVSGAEFTFATSQNSSAFPTTGGVGGNLPYTLPYDANYILGRFTSTKGEATFYVEGVVDKKIANKADKEELNSVLGTTNELLTKSIEYDGHIEQYNILPNYAPTKLSVTLKAGTIISAVEGVEICLKSSKTGTSFPETGGVGGNLPYTLPYDANYIVGRFVSSQGEGTLKIIGKNEKEFASKVEREEYDALSNRVNGIDTRLVSVEEELGVEEHTCSYTGLLKSFSKELAKNVKSLSGTGYKITGKNILPATSFQRWKIISSSNGELVADGTLSSFDVFIPIKGVGIRANFKVERVGLYDADYNFIERITSNIPAGELIVADAHFVRLSFNDKNKPADWMVIYDGYGDLDYSEYIEYDVKPFDIFHVIAANNTPMNIDYAITGNHFVPSVGDFDVWEPTEVTDDFSCPIGQGTQSISNLKYFDFIKSYFDKYIWEKIGQGVELIKYADGYTVKKEGLGSDASNTGYELFSYVFCPKSYKNTVLLSAGMNACEPSGYFGIAYFIKCLMEKAEPGFEALYNTTRFVIIPCLCPSSVDTSPIKYENFNGVNLNRNFSHDGKWLNSGSYPDSEIENQILKKWINKYNGSTFWIDCHSDSNTYPSNKLIECVSSDYSTSLKILRTFSGIRKFYKDKGYFQNDSDVSLSSQYENGQRYPKSLYAYQVCGIPSMMLEQYIGSTAYGSDGQTNNDSYGIKNYVTMLRQFILEMCKGEEYVSNERQN